MCVVVVMLVFDAGSVRWKVGKVRKADHAVTWTSKCATTTMLPLLRTYFVIDTPVVPLKIHYEIHKIIAVVIDCNIQLVLKLSGSF